MRICLVQSSYEDWPEAPYAQYDPLANPGHYISSDAHVFENRFVRKATAKDDIEKIVEEKFDVYCNFMWGGALGPVAGDDEYELLASKGVFILIRYPPLSLLDKPSFNELCSKDPKLHVPGNTPGVFPKICKYTDSCSSHNLHDLCNDEKGVEERIAWMKSLEPGREVLTQDYIFGDECSAMVIELGNENVVALTPLEYLFPDTKDTEAFLSFEKKFDGVEKGKVLYGFVRDEPRRSAVQEAAVAAFNACREGKPGCWARVDVRYDRKSHKAYVIEIGNPPVAFYPPRNTLGDDLVVEKTFPGGQQALFDLMLLSRHQQLGKASPLTELHGTVEAALDTYDHFKERTGVAYDILTDYAFYKQLKDVLVKFDLSHRTILDLGCGTGLFGRALHENGQSASITGVDISRGMTGSESIRALYEQPIIIETIESFVMRDVKFDSVVCFSTTQLLHPVEFNSVLARMFMIARMSVSFTVTDISQSTTDKVLKAHGFRQFNLIEAAKRFGVPPGWKLLMNEKKVSYISPTTGEENSDIWMHFERDEDWVPKVPRIDYETHMFVESQE